MGSSRVDAGYKSFTAGEALEPFRRVKLGADGKTVVYADEGDKGIGTTIDQRITSAEATAGARVTVRMDNAGGTCLMTVDGDIADKSTLYAAADGKVSATGGVPVAVLLDPGDQAEDGAALECVPLAQGTGVFTTEHTVTAGEDTAGQVDIDTGFGAAPSFILWSIRTSAGVIKMGNQVVTKLGSGDAGKVRFADGGTETVAAGDVISLYATP